MRKVKRKKIEKTKLNNNNYAYLIHRKYKDIFLEEIIVCIDYNFKSNTYNEGIRFNKNQLDNAYEIFNNLVKYESFEFLRKTGSDENNDLATTAE